MTAVNPATDVHTCPRCHLRFALLPELKAHFEEEHPSRDEVPAPAAGPGTRITVPLDPDRATPSAMAVALRLAGQIGGTLDLVATPGLGLFEGAQAFLRARAADLRLHGVTTATWSVLHAERPATAILEHLDEAGSDLVCMASRGSHGPGHLLFGSVAESVLRGATVPVLVCGPRVEAPGGPYTTVVACVDGSDEAATALAVADRLRRAIGADLHLVEVVAPSVEFAPDTHEGAELVRIAHSMGHPAPDFDLLHGTNPADAIVDHVGRLADAIVVTGTHGRSGLSSLLVGSVAYGVVAGSAHPTLVVPRGVDVDAFLRPTATTTQS